MNQITIFFYYKKTDKSDVRLFQQLPKKVNLLFQYFCYAAYSFWFAYSGDSLSTQIIFDMSHFFLFKTFYYLFFTRTRAPTSYAHRLLTALVLRDVQYYIIILSRTFLSFQQFESSTIILILTMILIVYEARIVVFRIFINVFETRLKLRLCQILHNKSKGNMICCKREP